MNRVPLLLLLACLVISGNAAGQQVVGYSLDFDGSNDYVEIPSNLSGLGVTDSFTVAIWISADDKPGWQMLLEDGTQFNGSAIYLGVRPADNRLLYRLNTTHGSYFDDDVPVLSYKNRWAFLTYTYDGSSMRLYLDGVLVHSRSITGAVINGNRNFRVGYPSGEGYYSGLVDEFSVWSRALSQEEIAELMQRQRRGNEEGLAGYWTFDEGAAAIVLDQTSNGKDAVLGGGDVTRQPYWTVFNAPVQYAGSRLVISPNSGGDIASVTTVIYGDRFESGLVAELVHGGESISGTVEAADGNGRSFRVTFDLTGRSLALWDVIVTNPSGLSDTLIGGFTIEPGNESAVWVDILGRNTIRVGRQQTYTILYGTSGNVDAKAIPLWIGGIPPGADYQLSVDIQPPPAEDQDDIDWTNMPISINRSNEILIPLIVSRVRPQTTYSILVSITLPSAQDFSLRAWVNPSLLGADLFPAHLTTLEDRLLSPAASGSDCLAAIITSALDVLGLWPGTGCVMQIASYFAGYVSAISTATSDPGVYSGVQVFTSAIVGGLRFGAECVVDFIPVVKQIADAVQIAVDLGRVAIDCHEVFDDRLQVVFTVTPVASFDPNEKVGSSGKGTDRYLSAREPLHYQILFENLAAATAPAQEVFIADTLDIGNLDIGSLTFGSVSFGSSGKLTLLPGVMSYATVEDLRPEMDLLLFVGCSLDTATGVLQYTLRSIDPLTGKLPDDPLTGFLPPNLIPPEGEGSVMFSVLPKADLSTGTRIQNRANIVFDLDYPIETNEWHNTIDNTKPESHVTSLEWVGDSTQLGVELMGSDAGSGVLDYWIYVSEELGPYKRVATVDTGLVCRVDADPSKAYRIYSVARDRVGNVEDPPEQPDVSIGGTTDVSEDESDGGEKMPVLFELQQNCPNPFNPTTTIVFGLPVSGNVTLEVFDVLGRKVRTLVSGQMNAGYHNAEWDSTSDTGELLSSGIYVYRLTAGDFVETRKMLLLK